MNAEHHRYMRQAIALSEQGAASGDGGPFGAVVVMEGKVIGWGWNCVLSHNDPTAHAEVLAIRAACRTLGNFSLTGAVIYSSCEPCPMCLSAIYWSRLDALYYAASREDAATLGFDDAIFYSELKLPEEQRMLPMTQLLPDEARRVFQCWQQQPNMVMY